MSKVSLSDHFTYKKLLWAVIPPIMTLIFTSIYGIVDGIFVANYAGIEAFNGLNLIWPITMAVSGFGYMLASGGSALVGKKLGEKDQRNANRYFSQVVYFTIILGIILSISGYFIVKPCAYALARFGSDSTQEMIDAAIIYGQVMMIGQFTLMLQAVFNDFFIVADKKALGVVFTGLAGISNIVFDAMLVAGYNLGILGAAIATVMSQLVGAVGPLIYFILKRDGKICIVPSNLELKPLAKACFNGSSEFISSISCAIIGLVYNIQLLRYIGEDGLASYGTVMYITFIFLGIFIGFNIGLTPIIAYHYGAKNHEELKNLKRKCFVLVFIFGLIMFIIGEALAKPLCWLFMSASEELLNSTIYGYRLYMISFIFTGVSIFLPTFFTGLNDGLVSAIISIFRTFIFQIITILVMPIMFGVNGIWLAITVSEILSILFGGTFLFIKQRKYQY